jgi:HSP20 family molecular chaperone IbpA
MLKENAMAKKPEMIEPVTTLHNEGKFIHIVSKLPGISEEKIKIDIDLEKTTITIVAADTTKIFKKIISLPGDVIFSKKRFSDGELHLTVEKKKS